jgi:hypothetical protein
MLRNLGRMMWSHERQINVLNFPKAIVYEIYNNDGYTYVKYCKDTYETTVENKRPSIAQELYTAEPSKKHSPIQ